MKKDGCLIVLMLMASLLICTLAGPLSAAEPDKSPSKAALLFLLLTNSPRVNAMGGCAVNLVDEQAAFHNPGALGLFHMNKIAAYSVSNKTRWLPDLDDDLRLGTYGGSIGASYKLITGADTKYNLSLGLAYSRIKLDYGTIIETDLMGNHIGIYRPFDKTDLYSAGVGLEYFLRVGIGYTMKKITSDLSSQIDPVDHDAHDFGVIVEAPLSNFIDNRIYFDQARAYPIQLELTPSIAYVAANFGDSIAYSDSDDAEPLPQIKKVGVSLYGAIKIKEATFISGRLSWERQRPFFGEPDKIFRNGTEIGLFDILFFRSGSYKDLSGGVLYWTRGFGINMGGLAAWLRAASRLQTENEYLAYLIDHVDLTYDYAQYEFGDQPVSGTQFLKLAVSF